MVRVLSLFDGGGTAAQALKSLGVEFQYHAIEWDRNARAVCDHHHKPGRPAHDVTEFSALSPQAMRDRLGGPVDILVGGPPCQDFSVANNKRNLRFDSVDDFLGRNEMMLHYDRIRRALDPRIAVCENVASMPADAADIISRLFGCGPNLGASANYGAQRRRRFFWVMAGVPVQLREYASPLVARDIMLPNDDPEVREMSRLHISKTSPNSSCAGHTITRGRPPKCVYGDPENWVLGGAYRALFQRLDCGEHRMKVYGPNADGTLSARASGLSHFHRNFVLSRESSSVCFGSEKAPTVTTSDELKITIDPRLFFAGTEAPKHTVNNGLGIDDIMLCRTLTPRECERLMNLPDDYTAVLGTQAKRRHTTGNGFDLEIVADIFAQTLGLRDNGLLL